MKIGTHRGFFESLSSLGKADQSRTWDALEKLQSQPQVRSLRWHTVSNGFLSLSPTMELRMIGQLVGNSLVLLHVGHHDEAYVWAERHRLVVDPLSSALELFPVTEGVVEEPKEALGDPTQTYGSNLATRLATIGVPKAIADEFRMCTDEDAMLAKLQLMSPEWQEVIFSVASGETVSREAIPHQSSLVRPLSNDELLSEALTKPINAWRYFLHPRQRASVNDLTSRVVAVSGGPGTGKSVVLAHRAVNIARHLNGEDVVVVFGLALNLVSYLRDMVGDLWSEELGGYQRIWVMPCDNVVHRPPNVKPVAEPAAHVSVGIEGNDCYLNVHSRRRRIAAILVDEAHDCPEWFHNFLERVAEETRCSSVTVTFDPNQAIFRLLNRQTSQTLLPKAVVYRLPYSYRMTRQLVENAFSVLSCYAPEYADHLDLGDGLRVPVATLTGPKIRYLAASGSDELVGRVEDAMRDIITRYPDEKSLAVIHLQYASSHFKRRGRVDPVQEALKASSLINKYYRFAFWTKGLEYYAGVVVCPYNFMNRDLGNDLLLRLNTMFVALTRFRDELTIVYDPSSPAAKYLTME